MTLCNGILRTYNRLLVTTLHRGGADAWTDFEVSNPQAFDAAGLAVPVMLGKMPIGGGGSGVMFYRSGVDRGAAQKTIGVLDAPLGHSVVTVAAILGGKYDWSNAPGPDVINPLLPYRSGQVEAVLLDSILDQQSLRGLHGGLYLTEWPNFNAIIAQFRRDPRSALPMLGGMGPTIRPFQYNRNELYFIIDGYLSLSKVKTMSSQSPDTSTIVVERFTHAGFQDMCYLVLAPSKLAGTLGDSNVER